MADKKQKSIKAFNQQAATYDQDLRGRHARSLYPVLAEKLSFLSYHSALDLGCGTGEMLRLLSEQDKTKELTGLDISEKMLAAAEAKLKDRVRLVLGDSEHLPFPDRSFDIVYCNDSFHHYPAPEKVLAEVRRVLADHGTFLMGDCWQPAAGRVIMNFYMRHSNEGDVKIYSEKEMTTLLSKFFSHVHWEQVGKNACIAWGEKITQ